MPIWAGSFCTMILKRRKKRVCRKHVPSTIKRLRQCVKIILEFRHNNRITILPSNKDFSILVPRIPKSLTIPALFRILWRVVLLGRYALLRVFFFPHCFHLSWQPSLSAFPGTDVSIYKRSSSQRSGGTRKDFSCFFSFCKERVLIPHFNRRRKRRFALSPFLTLYVACGLN